MAANPSSTPPLYPLLSHPAVNLLFFPVQTLLGRCTWLILPYLALSFTQLVLLLRCALPWGLVNEDYWPYTSSIGFDSGDWVSWLWLIGGVIGCVGFVRSVMLWWKICVLTGRFQRYVYGEEEDDYDYEEKIKRGGVDDQERGCVELRRVDVEESEGRRIANHVRLRIYRYQTSLDRTLGKWMDKIRSSSSSSNNNKNKKKKKKSSISYKGKEKMRINHQQQEDYNNQQRKDKRVVEINNNNEEEEEEEEEVLDLDDYNNPTQTKNEFINPHTGQYEFEFPSSFNPRRDNIGIGNGIGSLTSSSFASNPSIPGPLSDHNNVDDELGDWEDGEASSNKTKNKGGKRYYGSVVRELWIVLVLCWVQLMLVYVALCGWGTAAGGLDAKPGVVIASVGVGVVMMMWMVWMRHPLDRAACGAGEMMVCGDVMLQQQEMMMSVGAKRINNAQWDE